MKTNKNILLYINILVFCLFIGCKNEDSIYELDLHIDESALPVINLVKNYESQITDESYTKSMERNIEIDSYEKTTYKFPINNSIVVNLSMNSNDKQDSTTVDIYLVNFHTNDTPGWSIAVSDDRISRVYAYTEAGHISDTSFIYPLAEIVKNIPKIVEADINEYYANPNTKATGTYVSIGPLLKTSWNQWEPYNRYVPVTCGNSKAPLGCVATAASQAIAYYNKFKPTYYGNDNLDLTKLSSMPIPNTTDLQNQAATFCHEVAMYCQMEFGCNGSGSQVHDAAQYMKEMGYNFEFKNNENLPGIDINKAYTCLNRGNIIMTGGTNASGSGGHAWLYDGIRGYLNGSSFTLETFHCNWGQGNSGENTSWGNGWYVNHRLPVSGGEAYTSYNDNVYIQVK